MDIIEFIGLVVLMAIATFGLSIVIVKIDSKIDDIEDEIRELKDKENPKKPIKKMRDYICSYCSHTVYRTENFCSNCGNGIDWGNE